MPRPCSVRLSKLTWPCHGGDSIDAPFRSAQNPAILPRLRTVDARPIVHDGQPAILLRDPLQLTDKTIIIPQQLGPVLALCDGTRDSRALYAALAVRFGLRVAPSTIDRLLAALDDAFLLDNERFALARESALTQYRQAPARPPAGAGRSYPADAAALRGQLQGFLKLPERGDSTCAEVRGLVSPHIDYGRGGAVYAQVWERAAEAARAAETVILLGTDHYSDDNLLTLTRQNYATPFGILPTDTGLVDALAEAIGPERAFAGELHHRGEHSIELAAVWLHYVRNEEPCRLIPILCGSFQRFVQGEVRPLQDELLAAFVQAGRRVLDKGRVLIVAAADLSHVGPAFGGQPLGLVERARLQAADDELIELTCAGDAPGLFTAIQRHGDRHNVCGLPPIYLALRLLSPVSGEKVAYQRCSADEAETSAVSVCGIVFRGPA
jgi:AmmeMemoRadiSam system protein B